MAVNDPISIYDIWRFTSVILLFIVAILSNTLLRKSKIPIIIYVQLALVFVALSAAFSTLRFWFYPLEFALLEYVFFALGGFVFLVIHFNFRKMGKIDHDGIPIGDIIG